MADRRPRPRPRRAVGPGRRPALSDPGAADLVEEARRLDAEATQTGSDTPGGRDLRARAAALRVQALGERVYPVLVCSSCFELTGWLSARGTCDACVRREELHAAFADPHGDWVSLDGSAAAAPAEHVALRERLGALRRRGRDELAVKGWLRHVEPGDTGPVDPEAGYEIEVAVRDEVELVEGAGILVRFTTATHRFDGSAWGRLETTRVRRSEVPNPTEFAAALPVEQLVEAWGDYRAAVAGFNRDAWARQAAARESDRRAREERAAALREQAHTADLLSEDS